MEKRSIVATICLTVSTAALFSLMALLAYATPESASAHSPVAPGDVLINEFIATPSSAEAIELYNQTGADVDVSGWTVDWGYGSTTINAGQVVSAGGYLVLDNTNTGGISVSNDGTILALMTGTLTIDSVGYGDDGGCPKPFYNTSAARAPNGVDTGDDAADFGLDTSHTLGAANDAPAAALGSSAIRINEIMPNSEYSEESVEFIELYNDSDAAVDIGNYMLQVDDDYYMPSGATIPARGFYTITGVTIHGAAPYFNLNGDEDNLYLYDSTGARTDQVGWDSRDDVVANGESFQRIPDGASPYDGYSWTTSGGEVTLFQMPPTQDQTNVRNLTLLKDGPSTAREGEVVSFTITFGNMAANDAQGVVITDELPSGVEYAGYVTYTTDLTLTGTTPPTWDAGTVPSHTTDLTFTVRATFTGPFSNRQVVTNVAQINSILEGFDRVSSTLRTTVFTKELRIHDI
ncbi:MAG: lamin tail domain-containing protein, partial [Anaerolineae bacterium]